MGNTYKNILAGAVEGFYEARALNKEKEQLYFKGLCEGMMKIIREAELLSRSDIDDIIDLAPKKYAVKDDKHRGFDLLDFGTPTYKGRQGYRPLLVKSRLDLIVRKF